MSSSRTHFFLCNIHSHTQTHTMSHTHSYALWFALTFCAKFLQRFGLKFFCVFTTEFSPYNFSLSVHPTPSPPTAFRHISLCFQSIINTHKRPVKLTFKHAFNFCQHYSYATWLRLPLRLLLLLLLRGQRFYLLITVISVCRLMFTFQ